jgi:hypothetical protein
MLPEVLPASMPMKCLVVKWHAVEDSTSEFGVVAGDNLEKALLLIFWIAMGIGLLKHGATWPILRKFAWLKTGFGQATGYGGRALVSSAERGFLA